MTEWEWKWVPHVLYACPICAASVSLHMRERHMAWHEPDDVIEVETDPSVYVGRGAT